MSDFQFYIGCLLWLGLSFFFKKKDPLLSESFLINFSFLLLDQNLFACRSFFRINFNNISSDAEILSG
jgi:hypothetical protein